jgi:NAD(P)-dependent dehydrogenase (short-subunit alcohol dehydrogenase family)
LSQDPLFDLAGKVAVVTGAGGVLCSEIALAMAERGASVALLGRTLEKVQKVEEKIREKGGSARAYRCDVLELEQLNAVSDQIRQELGACDILINGAGGNHPDATTDTEMYQSSSQEGLRTFFDLPVSAFKATFDLNFIGTLLPIKVFAKQMVSRKDSVVINVSSMTAFSPLTKVPAYSGAKAAVNNLTQWLATHFAPVNMRVNAVAPGFFITNQNERLLTTEEGEYTPRAKKIIANTPMRRFGVPEDLVGTVIWLCSDASKYVTGVVVPVDGGFNAYGGV